MSWPTSAVGWLLVGQGCATPPMPLPHAVQSPSLLPGKPEEGSLTQTGELRGILKGGQSWAARDKVDAVGPTLEKAVKFDGVSMLFSAAMEGEFEVFVEASRQVC